MCSRKSCIFLVSDSIEHMNTGKAALQNDYTVITISSGEKLFEVLEDIKPDLILLDADMPDISGYGVIKKMKSNQETSDIPVIFLADKNGINDELLGLSLGAVDYIFKPFSQPLLLKRVKLQLQMQDIAATQTEIIKWAAEAIEFRDRETGQHIERMKQYLMLLVEEMKKNDSYAAEVAGWDVNAFLDSTLLHDVGKIRIRDEILLKPSPLTDDELSDIRHHPSYGKTLIEKLETIASDQNLLKYAKVLAHRHHERWDGTGYPDRLKGDEIPLQARMMSLADVYDALISERPYKNAMPHEDAMKIISEGRGTQFDPVLTDLFLGLSGSIREITEQT